MHKRCCFWLFESALFLTLVQHSLCVCLATVLMASSLCKFKGFMVDDECAGSYGSTLRYKNIERVKAIGKHSLLGASGEISDFQEILRYLDELV